MDEVAQRKKMTPLCDLFSNKTQGKLMKQMKVDQKKKLVGFRTQLAYARHKFANDVNEVHVAANAQADCDGVRVWEVPGNNRQVGEDKRAALVQHHRHLLVQVLGQAPRQAAEAYSVWAVAQPAAPARPDV
jgi:GH18 family chitinase